MQNNSSINNLNSPILTGEFNIVNNERILSSYPKFQSIDNQSKFVLRKLVEKYKLVLINSLRLYQMTKTCSITIFQNGKVMFVIRR